jgi:hypothetical protein
MNEISEKNKKFLTRYFPDITHILATTDFGGSFSYSSSPRPNIFFKNRAYHSKADYEKEAVNLVKDLTVKPGYIFIFMGIGLGYHIETFFKMYGRDADSATLIAIEKSVEAFSILAGRRDISFLKGVRLFIGCDFDIIADFFERLNPLSFKGYRFIKLRGAFSAFSDYYTKIESYFKRLASGKLSDLLTRFAFESLWMKNIIRNIPSLIGKKPVNALKNSINKKPALVIGAGPSLSGQLEAIKRYSDGVYIIAVDTALGPLIKCGIKPDVIVTLDAQVYNICDFFTILTGKEASCSIKLVADTTAYPGILKYWKGTLYFTESVSRLNESEGLKYEAHPLMDYFRAYLPPSDALESGGSVTTTAIELALYMGAWPVIVTGFDLSYTSFMTHLTSSPVYNLFAYTENRFKTLQSSMAGSISRRRLQRIQGVHGEPVLSDFVFIKYIEWIQSRHEYKNSVLNATAFGALIPNLRHIRLDELNNSRFLKNKKMPLEELPGETVSKNKSLEFLCNLKGNIARAQKDLKDSLAPRDGLIRFIKSYPFLKNILLEARAVYTDSSSVHTHMIMFLHLLEKQIGRSAALVGNGEYKPCAGP